jgi:hypothetical protein
VAVVVTSAPVTTTVKPPATTTTKAPRPPALKPAASGRCAYRTTATDEEGTHTSSGNIAYSEPKDDGDGLRQIEIALGDGYTTRTIYGWRPDGLHLRSAFEGETGGEGYHCDYEPDVLPAPSPLVVGKTWAIASTCLGAKGRAAGDRLDATAKVARTDRVPVAGAQVAVHVIETSGKRVVNGVPVEFRSTQYFSLDRGLVVREETSFGDGSRETTELTDLDPN